MTIYDFEIGKSYKYIGENIIEHKPYMGQNIIFENGKDYFCHTKSIDYLNGEKSTVNFISNIGTVLCFYMIDFNSFVAIEDTKETLYPHKCPRCDSPAFISFMTIECTSCGVKR